MSTAEVCLVTDHVDTGPPRHQGTWGHRGLWEFIFPKQRVTAHVQVHSATPPLKHISEHLAN